jgi:hypothetical protein
MAKSMVPPAPHSQGLYKTFGFSEYNQPARIASQTIRAPCSAAQRSASHRKQSAHRAAQRSARMQPDRAHCIANNPRTVQRTARTDNQPAAHHHHTLRTCKGFSASQYFALVSFGSWY